MLNVNEWRGCGRLVADPELRISQNGNSFTRIIVAIERDKYGDKEKETDFVPVVALGKTAEFICNYFSKGSAIYIYGSFKSGSYIKNGEKVYTNDMVVERVKFVESKFSKKSPAAKGEEVHPVNQPTVSAIPESIGNLGDFEEVIGDSDMPF